MSDTAERKDMAHRAHAAFSPVEAQTDAAASAETRATELMPEAVELKPNGPAPAAILGAAKAVFSLGVMFVWAHSRGDPAERLGYRERAAAVWIAAVLLLTWPPIAQRIEF